MVLWSVYHQASERCCAVRKVLVESNGLQPDGEQVFSSVQEAQSVLARQGLVRVPRAPGDEPALVETWL